MTSLPKFLRWGPYDDLGGWMRGLVITLVASSFMALAGAFGSNEAPLLMRFV